jgi:hypothetical protein
MSSLHFFIISPIAFILRQISICMKNRLNWLILLLVLVIGISSLKAQQIDSMMNVYALGSPKEKVHIHFDRPQYNKGDTIWYKVYLMVVNEVSNISKNIYLEWYDSTGTLIKQTVSPLYQSTAHGAFDIPVNYKGNSLQVKAFTKWMLNDDSVFIYKKSPSIQV